MKLFKKTFLYTLAILIMIALFANWLIYILMPKAYIVQKEKQLNYQTDQLVEKLEKSKLTDITDIIGKHGDLSQANVLINIGNHSYSMMTWNGGIITESSSMDVNSNENQKNSTIYIQTINNNSEEVNDDTYTFTGIIPDDDYKISNTIETKRDFIMEGKAGELTTIITLAPVEEAVGVIISLVPISILMCVVLAVFFSLLYARAITKPIKSISEETRRMKELDKNAKCLVSTEDEIGELASNVNDLYGDLLNTIESLENELKNVAVAEQIKTDFLRAASHELKTPVTAVSLIMDNMILGVGKYKNHEEWLLKCKEMVDKLAVMLHEILVASRLEDVEEPRVKENIEVICNKVLDPYIMIARTKGLSLNIDWSSSFEINVPPKLFCKTVSNIFSNAINYTESGGKLSIYCKDKEFVVENQCKPIPKDKLDRLFEPFYRPDESRDRNTGGTGLGLYITETILRLLKLKYSFKSMKNPEGMRFSIKF